MMKTMTWRIKTPRLTSKFDDDEFSPLSVDEIKLNEQDMHEDMRIVIKVRTWRNFAFGI